jgi:hypothetical protein
MLPRKEESVADNTMPKSTGHTAVAVDLAKSVFELAVSPRPGRVSERHRLRRGELLRFFAQRPVATVLLEACGSAHFWARELGALGHRVALLPPQHVRRFRPRNKTDRADAKAPLEAFRNEEIRPVPVKSVEQQRDGQQSDAWDGAQPDGERRRSRESFEQDGRARLLREESQQFAPSQPVPGRNATRSGRDGTLEDAPCQVGGDIRTLGDGLLPSREAHDSDDFGAPDADPVAGGLHPVVAPDAPASPRLASFRRVGGARR